MGIIISAITAIVTLIIKYIPSARGVDDCKTDECKAKFDDIHKRLELSNTDIQILKSTHVNQKEAIDGLRDDIKALFNKIDELTRIVLQNMNK